MKYVFEAAKFAAIRHHGQIRGGAGVPYITHCLDVADRIMKVGCEEEDVLAIGVLHDILEDTDTQPHELDQFGTVPGCITSVVVDLTLPLDCRKAFEKKMHFQMEKMKTMSIEGVLVKIADKTSNVNDLLDDPPKWRPEAVRGYADSAREVVRAAWTGKPIPNEYRKYRELLVMEFENTYNRLAAHFGWDREP